MRLRCTRSFDYLTAGEVYEVTTGKRFANYRNVQTGGGTLTALWAFKRAMADGSLIPDVSREYIREHAGC